MTAAATLLQTWETRHQGEEEASAVDSVTVVAAVTVTVAAAVGGMAGGAGLVAGRMRRRSGFHAPS